MLLSDRDGGRGYLKLLFYPKGGAQKKSRRSGSAIFEERKARTTVTGYRAPQTDEQTIRPDAKLPLVAGAGWTKKQGDGATHTAEAEELILGFLRGAQASLGGSKSLVDSNGEGEAVLRFMAPMNQIGQTGATPRHPKGLSTCWSWGRAARGRLALHHRAAGD